MSEILRKPYPIKCSPFDCKFYLDIIFIVIVIFIIEMSTNKNRFNHAKVQSMIPLSHGLNNVKTDLR